LRQLILRLKPGGRKRLNSGFKDPRLIPSLPTFSHLYRKRKALFLTFGNRSLLIYKVKGGVLEKVTTYQDYFNFARPNSYKGNKTPWAIVKEDRLGISPEVLLFPPVFLDDYFREKFLDIDRVGQKIPVDATVKNFFLDIF